MMRLEHKFVEFIPKELEDNVIYISVRFSTAIHKCACGCGIKTVTPFSPTDWKLIFDGKSISIDPSIGNWSFPCQSHYWITQNKVKWATKWDKEMIDIGREESKNDKKKYYKDKKEPIKGKIKTKKAWWKFSWLFKQK